MLLSWPCTRPPLGREEGLEDQNQNKNPKHRGGTAGRRRWQLCPTTGNQTARAPLAMGLVRPPGMLALHHGSTEPQRDPGIGCARTPDPGSKEPGPGSSPTTEQLALSCAMQPARLRQPAARTSVPHTQRHRCPQAQLADHSSNCTKDDTKGRGPGPPPQPPSRVKHPQRFPGHLQPAGRYGGGRHHT